jgi:hypothetical protein
VLLEPITHAGKMLLIAQYGSAGRSRVRLASNALLIENFNDANVLTSAFLDLHKAQAAIREKTGSGWPIAVGRGALGVAKGQLRQKLGREPSRRSVT